MKLSSSTSTEVNQSGRTHRILVLGATGTAGKATTLALLRAGHHVTCLVRSGNCLGDVKELVGSGTLPGELEFAIGDVTDPVFVHQNVLLGNRFYALVSCLASRTGVPADAWAIDYGAHSSILAAAKTAGVRHMVLLSAICVQKPLLQFQQAKLAFEQELIDSGLAYSIVRPTAFFKSLSGQVERVRDGKPFLLFGDGTLTACKPISDHDLGNFMACCLSDPDKANCILPIGGPGDAMTLRQQGEHLFALTGQSPRFRHVPIRLFDGIRFALEQLGRVSKTCADKAELVRIGRYYATESMLVLNPDTGRYDADLTPSTGNDTLYDFYAALLDGSASVDRGEHAVFSKKGRRD